MLNIFGFEIIKLNFFLRWLFFSASLVLALHYGLLLVLNSLNDVRKHNWLSSVYAIAYIAGATGIFYYIIKGNLFYRIMSYILLVLYALIVLSRTFVNWYSRTEEISKKLDKIIELLEKKA